MTQALANFYRPQNFSDVTGQTAVVNVLRNQLSKGAVARAYLLTGPAGCGKTTVARILAKEVNAEVIEIDGASNNGVDNIREIIERVQFKPIGKEKIVVIIDEVHMLSTGAFNALLKTLEEPPAHVVFILATTDPQKIPATILSRVQRFNFSRMTVEQIYDRLTFISEEEAIAIESSALEYIAKLAQGGMRAAISMLDTCRTFSAEGERMSEKQVADVLGQADFKDYFALFNGINNMQNDLVVETIEDLYSKGKDVKLFMKGFADFLVDFAKYQITEDLSNTLIPTAYQEELDLLIPCEYAMKWFEKINSMNNAIKYDHNPKNVIIGGLLCL